MFEIWLAVVDIEASKSHAESKITDFVTFGLFSSCTVQVELVHLVSLSLGLKGFDQVDFYEIDSKRVDLKKQRLKKIQGVLNVESVRLPAQFSGRDSTLTVQTQTNSTELNITLLVHPPL